VRALVAAAMAVALLLLLPRLAGDLGTLATFLQGDGAAAERWSKAPAILAGVAHRALLRSDFALVYWLFGGLAAAVAARRRRPPAPELLAFAALGIALVLAPFLVAPPADPGHEIDARVPRLLLHWSGPAWLWVAAALPRPGPGVSGGPSSGAVR
jgi:hypothetical protein